MKYKNILIASTTRTGSTYIKYFFYNNGNSRTVSCNNTEFEMSKNNILHFHPDHFDLEKWPNKHNWNLILSTRKDKFDQICSKYIAEHTGQWKSYDYCELSVEISLIEIITEYNKIVKNENTWRQIANKHKFESFNEIFYEDTIQENFLEDIAAKIGFAIEPNTTLKYISKSPYDKEKVISNYHKLKKQFNKQIKRRNYV